MIHSRCVGDDLGCSLSQLLAIAVSVTATCIVLVVVVVVVVVVAVAAELFVALVSRCSLE